MKTIHIRKFTLLSLFFIQLLPWLFFVTAHLIETKTFDLGMSHLQKEELKETIQLIETNTKNWTNPAWQKHLNRQLENANMDVSIQSELDKVIYQSTTDLDQPFMGTEQFSIIQEGRVIGRVDIYHSNSRVIQMIVAFVGLLLAFFIVAYVMRRNILTPLEKMSICARQIAEGNLDVQLPSSQIAEIAEVRDGFKVMVEGLKKSFQKQVELEGERRFVIASVAHDLRTPLFALRGYLDGLEQGIANSPEKQAKYLAICKEKSAQLDRLVEDLFTFTKTEYSEIEPNQNKVDLAHVLKNSIDSIKPKAQQKHISIIEDCFRDHYVIEGDTHLLERAMNNLLDNAIRHTPYKGKIFIKSYKDRDRVCFSIRDTGEGFSSEEIKNVFKPLYRGEVSRNFSTGGFGLGLTISQRIIRVHGGDLIAENCKDGGALLTGWVPLAS
ncbi:HAMP domain-containing histidine kinase [Fictibacillus sp. WQ 8-8]|uniref:sensor histidine kinase n=1 Tax=Fictibacillus sp. WQ 8-8 TaxID=2938788 RepID=UPI0021099CAA|nr:HAMP domain-containing sensor histidine kinase [Fictibacillus sp. WQ 8-8]MCQ6268601.1 HAMP domain-containing histidine kinase [Fictibacillus sp. WQ 8-8]